LLVFDDASVAGVFCGFGDLCGAWPFFVSACAMVAVCSFFVLGFCFFLLQCHCEASPVVIPFAKMDGPFTLCSVFSRFSPFPLP